MELNANTGSPQPFEDVAMLVGRRGIKPDHGQMHGREHIVWNVKQAHRQGSEKLAVERELTIAFGHNALKTLQLAEAQGSLQIREAVVEAKLLLLIDPGTSRTLLKTVDIAHNAMATKLSHLLRKALIIGGRKTPLTGGNDLHRVEAEHADGAVAAVALSLIHI